MACGIGSALRIPATVVNIGKAWIACNYYIMGNYQEREEKDQAKWLCQRGGGGGGAKDWTQKKKIKKRDIFFLKI